MGTILQDQTKQGTYKDLTILFLIIILGIISLTLIFQKELLISNCKYDDWSFLQEYSKRFAINHEYNITDFNCKNYSTEYKECANHLGYDVKIKGAMNKTTGHVWNKVILDVEPYNGNIVNYKEEYPINYPEGYINKRFN